MFRSASYIVRRLRVAMLLAGCTMAMLTARSAIGQDTSTYDAAWRGEQLSVVLEQLFERIDLSFDPLLIQNQQVFCVIEAASMDVLLNCILRDTGLDFYRRSSGTYVLFARPDADVPRSSIIGSVLDGATGTPLPFAHVAVVEASVGRATNRAGRFAITDLLPGPYHITASYLGYVPTTITVDLDPGITQELSLTLEATPVLLSPAIEVSGVASLRPSDVLGQPSAERAELLQAIGLRGATSALASMLGVRPNDTTADLHVQGGDPGEHQFRLDGVPLYLPLHVVSFVGPFSPFALRKMTVHKAGFEARIGSQIAGVIDATHEDIGKPGIDVHVDPISANGRLAWHAGEGDLPPLRIMLAGRYGLWDVYRPNALQDLLNGWNAFDPFITAAFTDASFTQIGRTPLAAPDMDFADVHGVARLRFNLRQTMDASFYWSRQSLDNGTLASTTESDLAASATVNDTRFEERYGWENGMGQVSFGSVLSARLLHTGRLRGSFYRLGHDVRGDSLITFASASDDGNQINEIGLENHLDFIPTRRHHLRFGSVFTYTRSRFDITGAVIPIAQETRGWRWAGYAEDTWTPGLAWKLTLGTRLTYLHTRRTLYTEPRFALRYDATSPRLGEWAFRLSGGLYRQFVNQFDVSSRGPGTLTSTTRFWIDVDETVRPQQALHLAAEVLLNPSARWSFQWETYLKDQRHILALDYAVSLSETAPLTQRDYLRSSKGHTYGTSIRAQYQTGLGRIQTLYDYTIARRQIPGLYQNQETFVPWSEPHRVEVALDVTPISNLTFLSRCRAAFGRTWGYRQAYYDFLSAHLDASDDFDALLQSLRETSGTQDTGRAETIIRQIRHYELTQPDQHRLPDLLQLDLSAGYRIPLGTSSLHLRADVLNVLNATNVAEWVFAFDADQFFSSGESSGLLTRTEREILPRTLLLSARLAF